MSQEMNRILAGLAGEVQIARKRESELTQAFREMESQLGGTVHSGVRLIQLQREADANRSIYETFLGRYKHALEQESLAVPDARLISRAEPPETPISRQAAILLITPSVAGCRWPSRLPGEPSIDGSGRLPRSKPRLASRYSVPASVG
jgi:uncharacterized protein involved in exopolysaccharide biosynthesis